VQFGLQFAPPEAFEHEDEDEDVDHEDEATSAPESAEPEAKVVSLDQFRKK
jgi:hypothetical protein